MENQQTLTGKPAVPEQLLHLPVSQRIHDIDFAKKNIVLCAQTGAGKSVVVPPYEATLRRMRGETGCIAMRCPTKVTGVFLTQGIRKFWPSLKVATLNRDIAKDSKEEKACKDADIVIISDGSLPRLMNLAKVAVYYADEAHWPSLLQVIELGVSAKRLGLPVRLLSATIDEKPFMEYLGPDTAFYFLEGRSFPITRHTIWASERVFDRKDTTELEHHIDESITGLLKETKSALWFLPTRQLCEDMAAKYAVRLPTFFIHGGVSPWDAEEWVEKNKGRPFVCFCTTAAATGITVSVDKSFVADEVIESVMERGLEHTKSGPMGDNMALQAFGRVGRIREGDAYLLTNPAVRNYHSDPNPAATMSPKPVVSPIEKSTPFEVILALAQYGVTNDDDIDLFGRIDENELRFARDWLKRNGCLKDDGTLTNLGQRVASFPMGAQQAHLILTAPSARSQLVLLAAFCLGLQGTYGLVKLKPRSKELARARQDRPSLSLVPKDCVIMDSVPLSLAAIVREAVRREPKDIYGWANDNGLWAKSLFVARKDYMDAGDRIVKDAAKRGLIATDLNDPALRSEVHEHLKRHPLYRPSSLVAGEGQRTAFDSIFVDAFGYDKGEVREYDCWGIRKLIVKPRMRFEVFELGFTEPRRDEEPEPKEDAEGMQHD